MANIKTVLHTYSFNTRNASELREWEALRDGLKATHPRCMESHGGASHYLRQLPAVSPIELETTHLFSNQWNSAPIAGISGNGYRLFDWALDYMPNRDRFLKRGHWLEQTSEMHEVRRNTVGCGYCGKQEPAQKGYVFCFHCLDSEYLKASELHLLRMMPVCEHSLNRAPLTAAELAHLLPQYREAQLRGTTERGKARIAKMRKDITDKYSKTIRVATMERDGFEWLMNQGINTRNVIFYSHTERFSFGWQSPVDDEFLSQLLDCVSDFPFPYEINCADGRVLKGAES